MFSLFQIAGHDIRPVVPTGKIVAVVAIYGIAWLADTYFANYMDVMQGGLKDIVQHYPWAIAFAFFAVSVLISLIVKVFF